MLNRSTFFRVYKITDIGIRKLPKILVKERGWRIETQHPKHEHEKVISCHVQLLIFLRV